MGITSYMAGKKQNYKLTDILDGVEKAHKAEIQLYTSGHLNHNKLFKPQELIKHNYWGSSQKSASIFQRRPQFTAPSEASRKASRKASNIQIATRAKSALFLCQQSQASNASSISPSRVSFGAAAAFTHQRKENQEETKEGSDIFQRQLIREELEIPEMKMLKYRPTRSSRLCVTRESKNEYQFFPSYLAGVTKTDQFHKFMQVQKDFIAKQDLLENDYIGSKSAEHHERRLAQALQYICDCNRPHFYRLQAVSDVFEDICNNSLIFGDVLKEVKNEYELYMVILLESLPTVQYRTLQNEVKGMRKRTVMTHEIEEKRNDIQALMQKSKVALARNEELRHELEMESWASQSVSKIVVKDHEQQEAGTPSLSTAEQMASLRCQIIMKWEEIGAMEKEIKETMTFAGIANIREKTVKELEGEASKLQASNTFLKKQIKDAESNITTSFKRYNLSSESQRFLWTSVKEFLSPDGDDDPLELVDLFSESSLLTF
ncbi:uncharacterized protein C6orf118 homolog isoform X2 [Anolis carolinensis]|uniref:Chromosome 6 open reading frame 118 n=1 Tax=Anolis carolinensis TaxID=28377 RepID=H9G790_ANOCA|nr:PREDICTED: uncharacterized protein C6orf118 homolog isoform X2 [Anolis carolinensis]|eukprot:XP_008118522.1 PREDICTED: uncharacterized protein C6orf118 homolog isoform X2 [Anolis carolinensis]